MVPAEPRGVAAGVCVGPPCHDSNMCTNEGIPIAPPLDVLDVEPFCDEELLSRMADAEALTTQLMALQSEHLSLLRDRRLAEQSAAHADHSPATCTRGCCDPDGWVGLEVAQALAVTETQVARRIDTADRLSRYDGVREVVGDDLLQSWTATKLLEHLDALAPHVCEARLERIERTTLAWLLDRPRTVGQLNARMRRLLVQARSQDGADDAAATAASRYVRLLPADTSGLATLVARLPETDAVAVAGTLHALAAEPVGEDDARTREQREADVLVACVTGLRPAHGRATDLELTARPPGRMSRCARSSTTRRPVDFWAPVREVDRTPAVRGWPGSATWARQRGTSTPY